MSDDEDDQPLLSLRRKLVGIEDGDATVGKRRKVEVEKKEEEEVGNGNRNGNGIVEGESDSDDLPLASLRRGSEKKGVENGGDKMENGGGKMEKRRGNVENGGGSVENEESKVENGGGEVENLGDKVESGGSKVENGGSKVENRGSKVENRGSKAENGGSKAENGGSKAENGGSKAENEGSKAENGGGEEENEGGKVENVGNNMENGGSDVENGVGLTEVRNEGEEDESDDDIPLAMLRQTNGEAGDSAKKDTNLVSSGIKKAGTVKKPGVKIVSKPKAKVSSNTAGTAVKKRPASSSPLIKEKTLASGTVKKVIKKKLVKKKVVSKLGEKKVKPTGSRSTGIVPSEVNFKADEYVFVGGDEANEHRWWEDSAGGNEVKWQTLSHAGVVFPPEYIPVRLPLIYDKEEIILPPALEEIAMFYAAKLETDYVRKPVFNKNFFADFRAAMRRSEKELFRKIKDFKKCDFSKMKQHLDEKRDQQKAVPKDERKAAREAENERIKKYTVALVDGREEKVGNFRIEPPGLFLGRGEHPLMGKVKKRIFPEDITINVGAKDAVPECLVPGHKWGKIIHNNTVTWLANWKDTITNGSKYVWLAADSTFKTISDAAKFEKARKLHKYIEKIRSDYRKGWTSRDKLVQQRSVALYLIDVLALRVGNEKGDEQADTVGCCSLRVEHLTFEEPNVVEFDFLGKDSIRYFNSAKVERGVFQSLQKLTKGKSKSDNIFDRLTTSSLNEYLKSLMDGLSAKVFRTYNASLTLDRLLQKTDMNMQPHEKLVFYNQQNKEVAILCNHQRSLPSAHNDQMGRLGKKLEMAEEWLRSLQKGLEKVKKSKEDVVLVIQMVRENPKITPDMTDEQKSAERKRVADIYHPKERKMNIESLETNIERAQERVDKLNAEMQTKDDLKTVALGTSKINYLDPRISIAWCKKHDIPIERIFPKALTLKFAWSMESQTLHRVMPSSY